MGLPLALPPSHTLGIRHGEGLRKGFDAARAATWRMDGGTVADIPHTCDSMAWGDGESLPPREEIGDQSMVFSNSMNFQINTSQAFLTVCFQ
jgi:hypothetical protein